MIAFIKGSIYSLRKDSVIVDVQGVGYECFVSNPTLFHLNEEILLHTYQQVREDAMILFGFKNLQEHDLFTRLISVKGLGPKTAMNILSVAKSEEIILAIEEGNATYLKKLPGIGAKSASQIILDLKGKLVESDAEIKVDVNENLNDALDALRALGYKAVELNAITKELAKEKDKTIDEYVRKALGLLLKRKGV